MQTVLKAQHKATGCKPTLEIKREAMLQIENKTCGETERLLHTLFPQAEVSQERTIHKRDGGELRTIRFSIEGVRLLERARELLSHSMPGATDGELLERVMRDFVERQDPLLKAERRTRKARAQGAHQKSEVQDAIDIASVHRGTEDRFCDVASASPTTATPFARTAESSITSAKLTQSLKHHVIRRARGQCEYGHQDTRCASRYQLEVDHIIPRAKGGSNDLTNLRCLCRRHNQMMAERELGAGFMQTKRQKKRLIDRCDPRAPLAQPTTTRPRTGGVEAEL